MTVTRANVESILVKRVGKLLTAADLDGSTVDGSNVDLNDPIGYALRMLSYSVASVIAVADTDLDGVVDTDIDGLLDISEWRVLETILGNLDDVDITVGPRSESLSQIAKQVESKLKRLTEKITREYGIGLGELEIGVLDMNFATHGDDTVVA